MKTKQILLGAWAFAALGAMTSCSNEEVLGSSGAAEQQGDRYMAVRISTTGTSSRAGDKLASDAADKREYEGAEEDIENTIAGPEALRFYFFSKSGEPFYLSTATVNGTVENTNMVTPQTITPVYNQQGNEGATEVATDAVLVLGKPSAPHLGTVPSLVVVAANLTDAEFKSLAGKNLNDMKDVFTSYEKVAALDNKTTPFKMTTAVYANTVNFGTYKGMRNIMATLIPEKSICETPNAAKLSPVVCNIERLAAKVRVKGLGVYPVKERSIKKDEHGNPILDTTGEVQWGAPEVHTYEWIAWENGTTVKKSGPLYMNLERWKLCDVYKNVKLIKNINHEDDPFPNWNDPANKRCYWAVTPTSTDAGQLLQTSIDIYDDNDFPFFNYNPGANTEKGEFKNMVYVTPNAAMDWQPSSPTDREQSEGTGKIPGSTTSIVVLGKLCSDEAGTTIDLMRWSGTYYTPEALKELVTQSYNAKQAASAEPGQPITSAQVDFVLQTETGKDKNKYVAVVKPENTQDLETDKNNNYTKVADFSDISWWKGGRTSYWQNIQHAVKADGTPLYGVIRNHIYDYNMTGVVGLGLPGNSRENPDPEDESFVACEVHVLNWRVISKDVVLE